MGDKRNVQSKLTRERPAVEQVVELQDGAGSLVGDEKDDVPVVELAREYLEHARKKAGISPAAP